MESWSHSLKKLALVAVAVIALLAPAGASAATVVNGDFETGNLSGWQTFNSVPECGSWFAYTGSQSPIVGAPVTSPPQGSWGAATDQADCGNSAFLYQDVALEPGLAHRLSMYVYYRSLAEIQVPSPNSLSLESDNQQMRVDVIKPTAPIESINPDDILATVFANETGDAETMAPTLLTADLTPLGGQTVRLRAVVVAGNHYFHGSIDGVALNSTPPPPPPPPPPPANDISRGKLTLNKKNGSAKLAINVPGAGSLQSVDARKAKSGSRGRCSTRRQRAR